MGLKINNYLENNTKIPIYNAKDMIDNKLGKTQEEINSEVKAGSVSITWEDLKDIKDNSKLIPGTWYRITDYDCTTTTGGTTSAGHPFDVIVRADNESTLNETAYACQSERDTNEYFSNSKLESWELKYNFDNDTARFAWADANNGKGVIYYMKDEKGNEIPYDFKNIQFYRSYDSSTGLFSTINSDAIGVACYTFSSTITETATETWDASMTSTYVNRNIIKPLYSTTEGYKLNNICSFGSTIHTNSFETDCYNNTLGDVCYTNTFGKDCSHNIFTEHCSSNTLGLAVSYITLGKTYIRFNTIEPGTEYVKITSDQTTSQDNYIQNLSIHRSMSGTKDSPTEINIPENLINSTNTIIYA